MADATPQLLITDAGLAAASIAMPEGPYIHITGFQIGSAYGYVPQRSDTGINGNLLFQGVPTSYQSIGDNTLNIVCEIPPAAGPFEFGEVALFLDGGVMFAKAVFDNLQEKFSSLGTNVVSSYTFNCLLKLEQSTAVFQIDTISGPPAVYNVFQWSDVFPPGVSANPDVPLYLVKELDSFGDSTLLENASDSQWTVGSTYFYKGRFGTDNPLFTVVNSSTSFVDIAASQMNPNDLLVANRTMLLQTPDGFFRSVKSVAVSGANYRLTLNVTNDGTYNNVPLPNEPPIGSSVRLWRNDTAPGIVLQSQIVDLVPATAGQGTYSPASGVIAAQGLLHAPSGNTGRIMTGVDNLNSGSLQSGLYGTNISLGQGLPANGPPTGSVDAHIWIQNYGPNGGNGITQLYLPLGNTGGQPPFWRSYNAGTGGWTPWQSLFASGAGGSLNLSVASKFSSSGFGGGSGSITLPAAGNWTVMLLVTGFRGNNPGGSTMSGFVNGVQVCTVGLWPYSYTMMGSTIVTVGGPTTIPISASSDGATNIEQSLCLAVRS